MPQAPHLIAFDFFGSLELARRLAALADKLDASLAERRRAFDTALRVWTGPRRDYVAQQLRHEDARCRQVEASLRTEADGWARAWARAVDEHNQRCWRLSLDAATGVAAVPFDIPAPAPAGVPRAPAYLPTTDLWSTSAPGSGS